MSTRRQVGTSHHGPISLILDVILRLSPTRVLEIGVGGGKFGVLCREYLSTDARIEGIEGFAGYIGAVQRAVYDQIYIGDARHVLPTLQGRYDLALLIDVFEHLAPDDGRRVLAECERLADATLISVPATWSPQGEFEGNEYEIHRAQYGWRDLRALGFTSIWRIANHLIALRSPRPVAVRGTLLRWAAMSLAPLSVADFVIGVRDRLSGRRQLPPAR